MKKTLNHNTAVTVLTPDQVQDLAERIASLAVSRALQSVSMVLSTGAVSAGLGWLSKRRRMETTEVIEQ